MGKLDIIAAIRAAEPSLREQGIRSLALFGSFVRDEAGDDSDVDLLVEFDRPVGLLTFVGVQLRLQDLLGRKVDLVFRDSIHPALEDRILAEAEDVLAAA